MGSSSLDRKGLTVGRFARLLGLSTTSVYRRIDSGEIMGVKLHARPDCEEPCHCPIRIPLTFVGLYLERHSLDG